MVAPLKATRVEVFQEEDRVHVKIGGALARFPYAGAFRTAAKTRLAAKAALRAMNEDVSTWRDIVGARELGDVVQQGRADQERLSRARRSVDVWNEGPIVVWSLAGTQIRFEAETALQIQQWMRDAGRKARQWAGGAPGMIALGHLTNATPG